MGDASLILNLLATSLILVTANSAAIIKDYSDIAKVNHLPRVYVNASSPFLRKGHPTILLCAVAGTKTAQEPRPELRISNVQWMKNERVIDASAVKQDGSLQLHSSGRAGLHQLEGSYRCVGNLEKYSNVRLTSAPISIQMADIGKFPTRSYYNRRHGGGANDADWLKIETIQGQLVYIPCLGLPKSTPGPPIISFERIRNRLDATESEMITEDDDRIWLTQTGLQLTLAQPEDSGKYRCHVRNPLTNRTRHQRNWIKLRVSQSRAAKVTPAGPVLMPVGRLQWPDQPKTMIWLPEGSQAILECISDLGRIEWKKISDPDDATPLLSREHIQAKWGSLIISNITVTDSGMYECRTTAPMGLQSDAHQQRAPSAQYDVHVVGRTRANLNVDISIKQEITLTCTLSNTIAAAQPSSYLDLFVNGQSVSSTSSALIGQVTRTATALSAKLTPSVGAMNVSAQCVTQSAWNITGISADGFHQGDSDSAHLQLAEPQSQSSLSIPFIGAPSDQTRIRHKPHNITVARGDPAQMMCIVTSGAIRVYWMKDTIPLSVDNHRIRVIGSGTLDIDPVEEHDQGWYTCVAESLTGHRDTASAFLTIEGADFYHIGTTTVRPQFIFVPSPEPLTTEPSAPRRASSLDEFDMTTSAAQPSYLSIRLPAPEVEQSDGSVLVKWPKFEMADSLPAHVTGYAVDVRMPPDPEWHSAQRHLGAHMTQTSFNQGTPGTTYKFRVHYKLDNGHSLFTNESQPITVDFPTPTSQPISTEGPYVTLISHPPRLAPVILRVRPLSRDALEVTWTLPQSVNVRAFIVQYRAKQSTHLRWYNATVTDITARTHTLDHLLPSTAYIVRMLSVNEHGVSPHSNEIVAWTNSIVGTDPKSSVGTDDDWSLSPPISDVGTHSTNPPSTNRTAHSDPIVRFVKDLFQRHDRIVLLILAILALICTLIVCCAVACCFRRRKSHKIAKASRGKFLDASHRIYREQQSHKGRNVSLYQEALSGTLDNLKQTPDVDNNGQIATQNRSPQRGERRLPMVYEDEADAMLPLMQTVNTIGVNGTLRNGTLRASTTATTANPNVTQAQYVRPSYSEYEMQQPAPSVYGYVDDEDDLPPPVPAMSSTPTGPGYLSPYRGPNPCTLTTSGIMITNDVGTSPLTSNNSRSTPESNNSATGSGQGLLMSHSSAVPTQNGTPNNNNNNLNTSLNSCNSGQSSSGGGSHHQPDPAVLHPPLVLSTFKPFNNNTISSSQHSDMSAHAYGVIGAGGGSAVDTHLTIMRTQTIRSTQGSNPAQDHFVGNGKLPNSNRSSGEQENLSD